MLEARPPAPPTPWRWSPTARRLLPRARPPCQPIGHRLALRRRSGPGRGPRSRGRWSWRSRCWRSSRAGAAYLPLDPAYPEKRLAWMYDDARPTVVLSNLDTTPFGTTTLRFDAPSIAVQPATSPAPPPDPERLAYVIYTSGSTGTPKGVPCVAAAFATWRLSTSGISASSRTTASCSSRPRASMPRSTRRCWACTAPPCASAAPTNCAPAPNSPTSCAASRSPSSPSSPRRWRRSTPPNSPPSRVITVAGEACPRCAGRPAGPPGAASSTITAPPRATIRASLALARDPCRAHPHWPAHRQRPLPRRRARRHARGPHRRGRRAVSRRRRPRPGLLSGPSSPPSGSSPPPTAACLYKTGDRVRFRGRRHRVPRPARPPGQDPRIPHRARRDREFHRPPAGRPARRSSPVAGQRREGPEPRRLPRPQPCQTGGGRRRPCRSTGASSTNPPYSPAGAAGPTRASTRWAGSTASMAHPIPDEEMRPWLDHAVTPHPCPETAPRARDRLRPFVLFLCVAPTCERYVADRPLRRRRWPHPGGSSTRCVPLDLPCEAHRTVPPTKLHNLDALRGERFDTIILNSVVQYFPRRQIAEGAVDPRPGFLHARRPHLSSATSAASRWLPWVLTSTRTGPAPDADMPAPAALRDRIPPAASPGDEELVVDPRFFTTLTPDLRVASPRPQARPLRQRAVALPL